MTAIILTVISYIFAGGLGSVVTLFTIKAAMKKSHAEAKDMEEQAEAKAIKNDKDKLSLYDTLLNDMTNRMNKMLNRVTEAEAKNDELTAINRNLEKKYNDLESKYADLENKYKELLKQYNELTELSKTKKK